MTQIDRQPYGSGIVTPLIFEHSFGLEEGAYTIQDAALYLRATTPPDHISLGDWIHQRPPAYARPSAQSIASWIREGLRVRSMGVARRKRAVTFHDLIRMRMVALLRVRGLPLRDILEAEQFARNLTGSPDPFVTEPLWTYSSDAFLKFQQRFIAISRQGQYVLAFLNDYLQSAHHGLQFGEDDAAELWRPSPSVTIDPGIEFGAPCIERTRIQTEVVWSLHNAGDSADFLARSYDIDVSKVRAAINWEERLAHAA